MNKEKRKDKKTVYPYVKTTTMVFYKNGEKHYESAMDVLIEELEDRHCYILETTLSDGGFYLTLSSFRKEIGRHFNWSH